MRQSVHDYAVKFEEGKELSKLLETKGFASIPSDKMRKAHYPSDLTDCIRKRYYGFKGIVETNPMTFKGHLVTSFGSLFDDLIVKMTMRARIYVEDEFSFGFQHSTLKYPVSGRIDIIIEEPDGSLIPCEIKTINAKQYNDRELKWATGSRVLVGAVNEPKLAHVAQVMTYIYQMGTKYGYLIYFNKDNQSYKVHKIYWSQELFNDAIEDCVHLERYLELDTVPPRPVSEPPEFYKRDADYGKKGDIKPDTLSYPCGWRDSETGEGVYCKFFNYCWSDEILNSPHSGEGLKQSIKLTLEAQKIHSEAKLNGP